MYIKDLALIEKYSRQNEYKNWRFRSYLKMLDGNKIDRLIIPIYKDVIKNIDCLACGNCCRALLPVVKNEDIKKLESEFSITKTEVCEKYLMKDEENEFRLKGKPCIFLEANSCQIYRNRPKDCVSFPHIHKKGFTTRLIGMIENASICPIVFNVYEELKTAMRFR
jgi:Fe-S-cluster containining protein